MRLLIAWGVLLILSSSAAAQALIANVVAASNRQYPVIPDLQVGSMIYSDRNYTVSTLSRDIEGQVYIQTSNGDKQLLGNPFLQFDLNESATVFVGYDIRLMPKPNWLLAFHDTGQELITTDTTLHLYSQVFPVGQVNLGQNDGVGNSSMYSVVVVPEMTNPAPAPPQNLQVFPN